MSTRDLDQRVPNLHGPATVRRLITGLPLVVRMLEAMHVSRTDQGRLLGLSTRTVQRALNGELPTRVTPDQLTRMSLIVGIYKALHILHAEPHANEWLTRPSGRVTFGGISPLELMLQGGIPAMMDVRRMLDADRSGQFADASPEHKALAARIVREMRV